mgnify:CR=1 FL=1
MTGRSAVKIAVIGGAGVRTPAARQRPDRIPTCRSKRSRSTTPTRRAWRPSAASRSGCPPDARVTLVPIGRRMRRPAPTSCFTSIRSAASSSGCATRPPPSATASSVRRPIGPAGFAMAMRTIPHDGRATPARSRAARAGGLDHQLHQPGRHGDRGDAHGRAIASIGICDTPTELFEEVAHALGLRSERCAFDYFGLNHLGWLREVYSDGDPQLHRLWHDAGPAAIRLQAAPVRSGGAARPEAAADRVRLLLRPAAARVRERPPRESQPRRGDRGADPCAVRTARRARRRHRSASYQAYLWAAQRRLHADRVGQRRRRPLPRASRGSSGYDRIALGVVRAIHFNQQRRSSRSASRTAATSAGCSTTTWSRCRAW